MPGVTYLLVDGTQRTVDATAGASVMEAAIKHNVPGIEAECGGCLSCATCHVYVDEAWVRKLPAPDEDEAEMLEFVAAERLPFSRLSCQLRVSAELEGLLVRIPAFQVKD